MLRDDGPALVVLVSRQELFMLPTIGLESAKGFSLFMLDELRQRVTAAQWTPACSALR